MRGEVHTVRYGMAALGAILVGLMFGPLLVLQEELGLTDRVAYAVGFFFLTLIAFAVFPRVRRTDTASMVMMFAVGIEVLQGLSLRSVSYLDLSANALGVFAAVVPAIIDRRRFQTRIRLRHTED